MNKSDVKERIKERWEKSYAIAKVYKEQGEGKEIASIAWEIYHSWRPMKPPIAEAKVPRLNIEPLPVFNEDIDDPIEGEYEKILRQHMEVRKQHGLTAGASTLYFQRDETGTFYMRKCHHNVKRIKKMRVAERARLKQELKDGNFCIRVAKKSGE